MLGQWEVGPPSKLHDGNSPSPPIYFLSPQQMAGKKRGTKPFQRFGAASLPTKISRRKASDDSKRRLIQLPKSTLTAFFDTTPSTLSNPVPAYDCDLAIANSFNLNPSLVDEIENQDSAIQLGEETEYGDGYLSIGGFRVYADDSVDSDGFEESEWIDDDTDSSEEMDSDEDCIISDGDYEIDDETMDDYVEGVGGSCEILSSVWFDNTLKDGECSEFSDDQDGFGRSPAVEEYISLHGGKRRHHQELITMRHQARKKRHVNLKQVTNNKGKLNRRPKSRIKMDRKLSLSHSVPKTNKKRSLRHSAPPKLEKSKRRYSDKPVPFVSSGTIRADSTLDTSSENQSKNRSETNDETITESLCKVGAFELHTTGFGSKMLAKMGFIEGTGLGKDGQGIIRPIEPVQRPKSLGLGNQFSELKKKTDVKEEHVVKKADKKRVGSFEKHTKGFGSKMMKNMGFVAGKGLGKKSQGILKPLKSVRRPKLRGLGSKL